MEEERNVGCYNNLGDDKSTYVHVSHLLTSSCGVGRSATFTVTPVFLQTIVFSVQRIFILLKVTSVWWFISFPFWLPSPSPPCQLMSSFLIKSKRGVRDVQVFCICLTALPAWKKSLELNVDAWKWVRHDCPTQQELGELLVNIVYILARKFLLASLTDDKEQACLRGVSTLCWEMKR